ncbi:MAG: hypothetical protein ACON5H_12780 [Akkermansiaceae bacterium]
MKTLFTLVSLLLAVCTSAAPLTLKDKKGREISVTVIDYDSKKVTFKKGAKEYTVPWSTFDQASVDLIKSTPLPGAHNKRQERVQEHTNDAGEKSTVTVPAGKYFSKDGTLDLYIGDTIHLEFQKVEGQLSAENPIIVEEVTKPEQTMTFALSNEEGMTLLKRSGKVQKTVAFDCQIQNAGETGFTREIKVSPTSKGSSDEFAWPASVWRVQFSKFSVNDRSIDDEYADRIK